LLRADLSTRYKAYQIGIASGFLTRNDARQAEDLPLLDGLDTPTMPLNVGSGQDPQEQTPASPQTFRTAEAMAHSLAANVAAYEARLLADGKTRTDVYAKLPGYIATKTGLPAALCEDYCKRRAAQPTSDEAEGAAMLKALLLKGTL
jgi:hypothetical protein